MHNLYSLVSGLETRDLYRYTSSILVHPSEICSRKIMLALGGHMGLSLRPTHRVASLTAMLPVSGGLTASAPGIQLRRLRGHSGHRVPVRRLVVIWHA